MFFSIRDPSPRDFSIMTLFVERHESHSRHALNENFIGNVSQIFSAFVLISASSNIGFSPLHTKKEPSLEDFFPFNCKKINPTGMAIGKK